MIVFVKTKCLVGGCLCPAWDEWFQASEDTDPDAIKQGRDPLPLEEWPFNPLACERPDLCPLYASAKAKGFEG